jgi:hypothetical protein
VAWAIFVDGDLVWTILGKLSGELGSTSFADSGLEIGMKHATQTVLRVEGK